jgi:drug/metabolite transporter (DMT)-like permease
MQSAWALILSSVLLGSIGQVLLKRGMLVFGQVSVDSVWVSLPRIAKIPFVPIGFACFALSSILWLVVLSRWRLSYVYPCLSLNYVLVLLISAIWLREPISPVQILGVLVIGLGVTLVGCGRL